MKKLKPCPCGKTPTSLQTYTGYPWGTCAGDCYGDWFFEFRTINVSSKDPGKDCMEAAIEAWNDAPRGNVNSPATTNEAEDGKLSLVDKIIQISAFPVENIFNWGSYYGIVGLTESGKGIISNGDRNWSDISPKPLEELAKTTKDKDGH